LPPPSGLFFSRIIPIVALRIPLRAHASKNANLPGRNPNVRPDEAVVLTPLVHSLP
jgi:hypothetical protein